MIKSQMNNYLFKFLLITYISQILASFSIEELKHINYEVEILETPIKRNDNPTHSILMKSKYGQDYRCILPVMEEEDTAKKEAQASDKNLDIKEILKPLQTRTCMLKVQDWWTYEVCIGQYIKQFHIEEGHILGPVLTLGLYDSDYDWSNETNQDKFKNVKQPYHSQYYVNGTKCDLTGQPRNAELRFVCEPETGDYIYRVDEQETCSYIVTIHTSYVCAHPRLKPKLAKKAQMIPCYPVLDDEQYESYMKKIKDRKELEEQKRNQWLEKQQKRLQDMKNENLQQMEKIKEESNDINKQPEVEPIPDIIEKTIEKRKLSQQENFKSSEDDEQATLIAKYDKEIENLKNVFSLEQFTEARERIEAHFDKLLAKVEKDYNELEQSGKPPKVASLHKLTSTLNLLLNKLNTAEQEAVKAAEELIKATELIEKADKKGSLTNKAKGDPKKTPVAAEDQLRVQIKRLNYGSLDSREKLFELSPAEKKKLEKSVAERLEKLNWGHGDRKVEVKIITEDPFDAGDFSRLDSLTEEEHIQFQNMIMAMLTGQSESVKEVERQKKLEENYRHNWETGQEEE